MQSVHLHNSLLYNSQTHYGTQPQAHWFLMKMQIFKIGHKYIVELKKSNVLNLLCTALRADDNNQVYIAFCWGLFSAEDWYTFGSLVSIYGNKTNKNKKHVTQCTSMACVCAFNLSNIRLWPNTASLLFWCIMPNSIITYIIVYIITTIYNSV